MRIGAMDGAQPRGWLRNKSANDERKVDEQKTTQETRDMTSSESDNLAMNGNAANNGSASGGSANSSSSSSARPAPRATGGVPGAGVSTARTMQWKGKSLNMSAARPTEVSSEAEAQTGLASLQNQQTLNANLATLLAGMDEMCGGLQEIYSVLHKVSERYTAGEKVFNTLHAELSDYKKDFIYEHLKPVVRPLLFLYDSLEQFENEIERFDPVETQPASVEKSGVMPTRLVRQNTIYFREQLVEALRICEVTPMDDPEGVFNARFHKAVKVVPVEASEDGKVQRVVRSGWFLNGQLLRSAEVVVGKKK